ncbi:hypothetical protein BDN71DRAFT_862595 [Pleurotus eryngii]|uniref:F-box domain-containing protein n=1 Tax=Pleurotus eryngii TaxID=5323 RepID=A0A9P5ZZS1_PLEER|nr:hypothetical protein BDN71DRAFT_862595 [Pleurotus eryngii]
MVVVAHVGGVVLDFTPDLTELYRAGFTRLIGTRPMRTAITSTQEPEAIRRCRHALQSRLEMRADTQAPRMCQAEELLLGILRLVDFAGLAHTSRSCRQFRRLVKVVIKDRVAKTLTPYFPPSALGSFFYKLRLARGLIFGDVPLQIILDRCWTCTDLDVSVAYEDHADMIGWLGANGYPDSTESDQRFPGCKTYNMPHQTKEDVRVLLSLLHRAGRARPSGGIRHVYKGPVHRPRLRFLAQCPRSERTVRAHVSTKDEEAGRA